MDNETEQLNEYKYGATHEFRGGVAFMEKHAEKLLKKHGVQVHSVELLPDEKEVVFHVSGSVGALQKCSNALYELSGMGAAKPATPAKFYGSSRKYNMNEAVEEETDDDEDVIDTGEGEEDLTREEILTDGPSALLAAIADENPDAEAMFGEIIGAKIDDLLDNLKAEMAATYFAPEEAPEATDEELELALEEAGHPLTDAQRNDEEELTEEQIEILLGEGNRENKQKKNNAIADSGKKYSEDMMVKRMDSGEYSKAHFHHQKATDNIKKLQVGRKLAKEDFESLGIDITDEQVNAFNEASLWRPERGFDKRTGVKGSREGIPTGLKKLPALQNKGRKPIRFADQSKDTK